MQSIFRIPVFFLLPVILLITTRCGESEQKRQLKDPKEYKESLIKANQVVVKEESDQIDDFIRRHKWDMKTTSTGLR